MNIDRLDKNESGFGTLGLILIVVIIAVIGVAGWVVYMNHHKTKTVPAAASTKASSTPQASAPTKSTISTPAQSTVTNYFTISQWSIRAPYSSNLTLQYQPDSDPKNLMFVSSTQLNAGGPDICTTADGAAGYIGKYLPTDDIPTEGPPAETAQQFIDGGYTFYAKVGNYYYIYIQGQGNSCNDNALLSQTTDAFDSLVPNLAAY